MGRLPYKSCSDILTCDAYASSQRATYIRHLNVRRICVISTCDAYAASERATHIRHLNARRIFIISTCGAYTSSQHAAHIRHLNVRRICVISTCDVNASSLAMPIIILQYRRLAGTKQWQPLNETIEEQLNNDQIIDYTFFTVNMYIVY